METDNSHQAAADRAAQFNQLVQQLERSGGAPQQAQAQPAVTPNADDLAYLAEIQRTAKNEDGQRLWDVDSRFRERVENARFAVCRGESISALRANTDRVMAGGQPPAQQPAEAPAPPQGTPAERAADELNARLDAGEFIAPAEMDARTFNQNLAGGYQLHDVIAAAGPDFAISGYESHLLQQCAAAGIPESMIRRAVQKIIESQQ